MATHQANIDNLRTATLGEQVRGSMIQLFEEDYNLVKRGINVGTAVTSASSSTAGYYDGNLYINSATLDVWECNGSVWIRQGNLKGIADITETISPVDGGVNTITITLTDGTTKVLTVKNGETGADGVDGADGKDGVDGKSIANISLASTSGNVKNYDVFLDDGTKTPTGFSVEDGSSSYLHIRYSSSFDGTGMVTTPTDATVYIGILVSTSSVAPTNPSLYNWVRFIGKSGTGSGDMLASDYATKYPNTVDKAAALYDGTDEILANQLMKKSVYDADDDGVVDHATNADNVGNADTSLLEKFSDSYGKLNYNGNALMLEAAQFANQAKLGEFVVNQKSNNVKELALHSNITTKLSKVDNKIDKPTSATEGQILTYRNNEWVADDSQGGGQFVIIVKGETYEGQTVTATKGTKSKSAVITNGVARIPVDEGGVWTLTLSSGETFNTPNMTYYGEYEVALVPNGSTVTPTDDVQTWLKCAELNKSYTTISQVLADTNTLSALISDNNASDYLARSTTWTNDICNNESAMTYIGLNDYCAWSLLDNDTWNEAICYSPYFEKVLNVHLDTLNSSSTEATAESYLAQNGNFPYSAFDGNESTGWWAYSTSLKDSFWLQYKSNKLANVIMKKAILIGTTGSTALPLQDIVLYRNDNIPLCDVFKIADRAGDTKTTIIVFNNNKVGKSDTYKLITTCTPNGNAGGGYNGAVIFELQFYGRERA